MGQLSLYKEQNIKNNLLGTSQENAPYLPFDAPYFPLDGAGWTIHPLNQMLDIRFC